MQRRKEDISSQMVLSQSKGLDEGQNKGKFIFECHWRWMLLYSFSRLYTAATSSVVARYLLIFFVCCCRFNVIEKGGGHSSSWFVNKCNIPFSRLIDEF